MGCAFYGTRGVSEVEQLVSGPKEGCVGKVHKTESVTR